MGTIQSGHDRRSLSTCCRHLHLPPAAGELTRRGFLGGLGGAALGSAALAAASEAQAAATRPAAGGTLPAGKILRVKPVLVYQLCKRVEKSSWRNYGGSITQDGVDQEAARIKTELEQLRGEAEFPIEVLPVATAASADEVKPVAASDCDVLLVYALSGLQAWLETLAGSGKPNILFVRYRSGPFYLWYEIAHWRFLRKNVDEFGEPNMDVDDVVVDDYGEVLWRLRALYGLKNAKGTKSIALGGLAPYSEPAGKNGPTHVKEIWGYDVQVVPTAEIEQRLAKARSDQGVMSQVQRLTDEFLAQPNLTLQTDRKFVINTFVALKVFRDILSETGGTNVGVAHCMGSLITLLDTTPCLVLSILNDEGITAFCHTDYSHTPPGVLLRWIAGKPSWVCNSHFPHHGIMTLAHCAAPRRMNGRDFEPTKIMTHFESDYGAATKVEYPVGQAITAIIPNLRCTKWYGFRGKVIGSPAYDICRSQMDVEIDGDWRKLLHDMEGFHTLVVYGDYLREVGYVLKKLKIGWENVSENA